MKNIILFMIIILLTGCGKSEDEKRVEYLNGMPVLWQSKLVIADPEMPDLKVLAVMFDSFDGTLAQSWEKDKFTDDYIPEPVMAFTTETYRNKPRTVTIKLGDTVEVIESKKNNTGKQVCLVRTKQNTYAWVYSFHLLDKKGERMGSYKE